MGAPDSNRSGFARLRIVASDLLDEALRVLAADEDVKGVAERTRWRE